MISIKNSCLLVGAIFIITGCDLNISEANFDAKPKVQGKIYYESGELYGVTKHKELNINDTYTIYNYENGRDIAQLSLDNMVVGMDDNNNYIASICTAKNANDFDTDEYLVGSCTIGIEKRAKK